MKIKVIRAIESGIRMQTVADTMGLTLEKVREIRSRSNADIKAVAAFLQTATVTQKKMMAHVVRSSGGNELSSRRESLGVSRQTLRQWILAAEKPEDLIERVHSAFQLGGHKAAAIAMVLQDAQIDLVSEMDPDFVRSIFLVPRSSAQEAFDIAMKRYGSDATVIAMPFGGATLPVAK